MQQTWDATGIKLLATVSGKQDLSGTDEMKVPDEQEMDTVKEIEEMMAWDDVDGAVLNPDEVIKARKDEIGFYKSMDTFEVITIEECRRVTEKDPIDVRWVDHNKRDHRCCQIRSRLVAKQFNTLKNDEWYAATPLTEALRTLISMATSGKETMCMMTCDVSRPYMNAPCRGDVYVKMADEAREGPGDDGMRWKLRRAMYGTRAAAQDWQFEVRRRMPEFGFAHGRSNPCIVWNQTRGLACLVHGDDFVLVGKYDQLMWFKEALGPQWEIKRQAIGEHPTLDKEMRVLNKLIRWHPGEGVTLEADPRHAQTIIRDLNAERLGPPTTPMVEEGRAEDEKAKRRDILQRKAKGQLAKKVVEDESDCDDANDDDEDRLPKEDATKYRQLATRANYLTADRPDLMYSVKELARAIASPSRRHWDKLV